MVRVSSVAGDGAAGRGPLASPGVVLLGLQPPPLTRRPRVNRAAFAVRLGSVVAASVVTFVLLGVLVLAGVWTWPRDDR